MPRPLVAVTATARSETDADPVRVRLNAAYMDAVSRAGGLPIVAPPTDPGAAEELIATVDALLLTGGEDIDPSWYGAVPSPHLGRVTASRDAWEMALTRAAAERRIPILAVCRGIQVLNVALGGTLLQDIPSDRPGSLQHEQSGARADRTHRVHLAGGSRLAAIMGLEPTVNSMHHQAVDAGATRLAVVGTAPDGIIEAVESPDARWWAVGVQWHPEELDGADARLFAAFVDAARG